MPITFEVTPNLKLYPVEKDGRRFGENKNLIREYNEKRPKVAVDNGFIHTVTLAYNNHHNLILRPDDVWLAIGVQFAFYLQANAKELRSKFVDHEGKKELVTRQGATLNTADYGRLALDMAHEISKNIHDKQLKDWIIPDFSTTQPVDHVVGSMILMGVAAEYFSYKFELLCGLPSVTLEGVPEDWENLEARAARLIMYDCESNHYMQKWLKLLSPILAQFSAAARNKPDITFWKHVCSNHGNGSGPRYLSGWITVFSVFSEQGKWRGDLSLPSGSVHQDPVQEKKSAWPMIDTNDLACGKVKVDVTVDDNGNQQKCELVAGHMCMVLVDEYTVQPGVGWLIQKKQ